MVKVAEKTGKRRFGTRGCKVGVEEEVHGDADGRRRRESSSTWHAAT